MVVQSGLGNWGRPERPCLERASLGNVVCRRVATVKESNGSGPFPDEICCCCLPVISAGGRGPPLDPRPRVASERGACYILMGARTSMWEGSPLSLGEGHRDGECVPPPASP